MTSVIALKLLLTFAITFLLGMGSLKVGHDFDLIPLEVLGVIVTILSAIGIIVDLFLIIWL